MHGFEERGILVAKGRFEDTGRFGRMFPELRSLKEFKPEPDKLGAPGPKEGPPGPMESPPPPAGGAPAPDDNPRIKAGYTFLGQFIDHDLTLDATSSLEKQVDLAATTNFRTPAFELDSVYGRGPDASPALYDRTPGNEGMLLVEISNVTPATDTQPLKVERVVDVFNGTDLPRNNQGVAILGDHRNDENRIIGQLHVVFLKFHNRILDDINKGVLPLGDSATPFEAAQKHVRWHYQWIVLHEFLPRIVGQEMVDFVIANTDRNHVGAAYMPVEFSGATYRFGHSQIRPVYGIKAGTVADIFPEDPFAPPLKPEDPPPAAPARPDLRGGGPLPALLTIDWARFFGQAAAPSKLIDIKLSRVLLNLPNSVVKGPPPSTPPAAGSAAAAKAVPPATDPATVGLPAAPKVIRSLATRNLQRGLMLALPAGETIADFLAIPRLAFADVWKDIADAPTDNTQLTPLWFYILREAELLHGGQHLGGVGAYVVAQTFVNLLLADKVSFLWQKPKWTPEGGKFTIVDLINKATGSALTNETIDLASSGNTVVPDENFALMREGRSV